MSFQGLPWLPLRNDEPDSLCNNIGKGMRKIVVCIKPVPDPTHWGRMKMDEGSGTLKREGIPIIMNPLDKHAIEASLVLREERGGEIVLISMAPSSAVSILREGLAMGADRAVLLRRLWARVVHHPAVPDVSGLGGVGGL